MIEELITLGFCKNEAIIYLELLSKGALKAGTISKNTLINRRTTYDTLQRLIEKGYVNYVISSNQKIFQAVDPIIIEEKIKEKQEKINELLPKLQTIYSENKEEQTVQVYKGRRGIRVVMNEILKYNSYVSFGCNEKFPQVMKHDYFIFQKKKKKLRIEGKTLLPLFLKGKDIIKTAIAEFKYVEETNPQPISTTIYGNNVAIVVWSDIPVATVIENKELAKTYTELFYSLWNKAVE